MSCVTDNANMKSKWVRLALSVTSPYVKSKWVRQGDLPRFKQMQPQVQRHSLIEVPWRDSAGTRSEVYIRWKLMGGKKYLLFCHSFASVNVAVLAGLLLPCSPTSRSTKRIWPNSWHVACVCRWQYRFLPLARTLDSVSHKVPGCSRISRSQKGIRCNTHIKFHSCLHFPRLC